MERDTKESNEGSRFWFRGWKFLIKITLTKKSLTEPFRCHLVCSQTNIAGSWKPLGFILCNAFNTILQLSKSKRAIRIRRNWQVQTEIFNIEICWLQNTFSHREQCDIMHFQAVKIEVLAAECRMQFCKNSFKLNEVYF